MAIKVYNLEYIARTYLDSAYTNNNIERAQFRRCDDYFHIFYSVDIFRILQLLFTSQLSLLSHRVVGYDLCKNPRTVLSCEVNLCILYQTMFELTLCNNIIIVNSSKQGLKSYQKKNKRGYCYQGKPFCSLKLFVFRTWFGPEKLLIVLIKCVPDEII